MALAESMGKIATANAAKKGIVCFSIEDAS
jgi:hypothetical protein